MLSLLHPTRSSLLFTIAFAILFGKPVIANEDSIAEEQKKQIDQLFRKWDRDDSPGAALGVFKKGKLIYSNGYGLANLENNVPIDASTVFYMASVSKHFVTFCILLLEEQGKLSLDDEIQKHLPNFPRYSDPLTVRNFIHHTSGVRDYLELWRLKGNSYLDHIDEQEVYELIKRQKHLNFKPGSRYMYSNSCYFMLAMIVKKASGLSIRDFAQMHMFGPLGMKDTQFHDDVNRIIKRRAPSYLQNANGFSNQISRFDLVGSGGLYSNINDMARWDRNFYNNKLGLGKQSLIEKMTTEGVLNSGKSAGYAFGLQNGSFRGLKTVEHGGSLSGYRTHFLRIPDKDLTVVVLANVNNVNPSQRVREVAGILLGNAKSLSQDSEQKNKQDPASKNGKGTGKEKGEGKFKFITLSEEELQKFSGDYLLGNGYALTVRIKDDHLHMTQSWNNAKYDVKPVSPDTFLLPDAGVRFKFADVKKGKAQRILADNGGRKELFERKKVFDPGDLSDFAGSYFSEELEVHYEVFLRDGKLYNRIQHRYLEPMRLTAKQKDQFSIPFGGTIKFDRTDGKVTGFRIDAGRVTGLRFVRVKASPKR